MKRHMRGLRVGLVGLSVACVAAVTWPSAAQAGVITVYPGPVAVLDLFPTSNHEIVVGAGSYPGYAKAEVTVITYTSLGVTGFDVYLLGTKPLKDLDVCVMSSCPVSIHH